MRTKKRPFAIESLESRQLLFASVSLSLDGVLNITADLNGDNVVVHDDAGLISVVSVEGSTRQTTKFDARNVNSVVFRGSEAPDTLWNFLAIPSNIYGFGGADNLNGGLGKDCILGGSGNDVISGHAGNDFLDGGLGDDQIFGLAGDDHLIGNYGNDMLDGGDGRDRLAGGSDHDRMFGGRGDDVMWGYSGNDMLYGQDGDDLLRGENGDDQLYGGAGTDTMHGGNGNDSLYGGMDLDVIYGESGNDGLFGGGGMDFLFGGAGADRVLLHSSSWDWAADVASEDAVITFRDGGATSAFDLTWSAGSFTDAEIELIDQAFAEMHHASGNTKLLKTHAGGRLTFVRQGNPNQNSSIAGWNSGGTVHLAVGSFSSGNDWLHQVVFHEIGHNWDESHENSTVNQFRQISGWLQLPAGIGIWSSGTQYAQAQDNWWYVSTSEFARDYGRTDPLEDFATAFAAYFMDEMGRPYTGIPGPAGIPNKMGYMENFVGNLA
jgi:Ca2+-binding RTX toxin-like protein